MKYAMTENGDYILKCSTAKSVLGVNDFCALANEKATQVFPLNYIGKLSVFLAVPPVCLVGALSLPSVSRAPGFYRFTQEACKV